MTTPLFSMPSPFPDFPGTVWLNEPADANCDQLGEALRQNRYGRPFLLEDNDRIGLHFDLDYVQSSMRKLAPNALDLAYTRHMAAFVLFHPAPRQIALLGLGGGSLAKFCLRQLPLVRLQAIESDPDVIAFRDAFSLPPEDDRFNVVVGDGAAFIAEPKQRFDLLLVDMFDAIGIAAAAGTFDFYRNAHAALSNRGLLVANLSGDLPNRAAHLARIRESFGDNVLVSPVEDGCNHVVFAFQDRHFEPRWKWIASQARALEKHYDIELARIAERIARNSPHTLRDPLTLTS